MKFTVHAAKLLRLAPVALVLGLGVVAAPAGPSQAATLAPTITAGAGWWGPLTVAGSRFNTNVDDGPTTPVDVRVRDAVTGADIVHHQVSPTRMRCNVKGLCFGGGQISTSFSISEIGVTRHAACASVLVDAFDPLLGMRSNTVSVQLQSCLN